MDIRWITLADGRPVSGPGWVYAWMWHGQVRYVGATWLDPAVRAEIHLRKDTDHPNSVALREAVNSESQGPTIVAVPVPAGADRAAYRTALSLACATAGHLAIDFIGPVPSAPTGDVDAAWLRTALAEIQRLSQA